MALSIEDITDLFASSGARWYGGESVTQLEHALQCAQLAEDAGESEETIAACLLHDLGHLLADRAHELADKKDDVHQYFVVPFLRGTFGDAVIEPIRMHVDAKRYLCSVDPDYWDTLSAASKRSLELQGGRFNANDAANFIAQPYAEVAVRLRRYDDLAKVRGLATPPLDHYASLLQRVDRSTVQP
jgi:phosphonate degradation associated HDIG domain protein